MTKDFKKQTASENAFGQYGVGWMAGGITIGLLIGAGMYALANKGSTPTPIVATTASNTTGTDMHAADGSTESPAVTQQPQNASMQDVSAPANESPDEEIPGFSYHAVLPQLEIAVPLSAQAEQQAVAKPATDKKKDKTEAADAAKKDQAKKDQDKKNVTETSKKAETPPAATAVPTGFNGFQIGSYKTAQQAADMQNRLKRNGLNTRVEQASINGAVWFRVRLGPSSSPDMLQKWRHTLSGMGISPMAVRM